MNFFKPLLKDKLLFFMAGFIYRSVFEGKGDRRRAALNYDTVFHGKLQMVLEERVDFFTHSRPNNLIFLFA
ncbi:hypothetical protein SDC9_149597 [bioreactor metagenome]|uniref:Uncharacterized protein n=1 Tax=bioreactor metagenome TaxID=1076179 RepID=A0A645EK78_9ZZZZ